MQIMIYIYALPRALPQYRNVKIAGELVYPNRTVQVPRGSLHTGFIQYLGSLIHRLAANEPSKRVPSTQECNLCDITAADCPERFDDDFQPEDFATTDFGIRVSPSPHPRKSFIITDQPAIIFRLRDP